VTSPLEESIRAGIDAFNRRDAQAWADVVDDDLVNVPPHDWPEPNPVQGREAVWDFWVQGNEPFAEGGRFELAELVPVPGEDTAIAHVRAEMQGSASGAAVLWSFWMVLTVGDGGIARIEWYSEREQALAAAGLPADAS
jgi:ketosteroid isomerase-like protein